MKREQEKPYEDGDYMEVVKRYEDMLRKNKQYFFDVDEFEDIIDYYLDSNKFNSASIAAEFACNQHPYSPEIQVKIAQIYLDKKLPEKALEVVDKVEYMETFNYEIYIIKGSAYNMLNRVKEAIQFFDRAIQLSRENIDDVLLNIGLSFEQYNHFDIAVHYLTKACKLNPANWVALFETAFCYDKIDDFTNSIKYYNLYLDEDTFSANAWFNLGLVQSKLEDFEKALESFDYALILDESYSSAYFNKANILANQGKYQEAIDVYNEYCLIEPDDPTALCYMGECYEKLKAYDKALDFYQRTIKIDEEFDEAWYGTGMIHFLNEEYTKSLLFIKKALKLDEDNTEYLFTLASIYTKLEEDEHALSVYKK
jgi:tetratricopeptide (TPR) repeat protein